MCPPVWPNARSVLQDPLAPGPQPLRRCAARCPRCVAPPRSVLLKDSFVESFPPRDRPFMRQFAETQMFSVYCDAVI